MKLKTRLSYIFHKLMRDGIVIFDEISITFDEDTYCNICRKPIKEVPMTAQINSKLEIRFICTKCKENYDAKHSMEAVENE